MLVKDKAATLALTITDEKYKGAKLVVSTPHLKSMMTLLSRLTGTDSQSDKQAAEPPSQEEDDPLKILNIRLAKGEITVDQYLQLKKVLELG